MNLYNILNTGDIILFEGNYVVSQIIEFLTDSKYSHIGIIIKNPKFLDKNLDNDLYLLESGYENINDPENNRKKYGVQLTKFSDIIKNYSGQIFYRKLNCIKNKLFYDKLYQIHLDVHNIPYDTDIFDWIKAKLNLNIGDTQKKNKMWCSALVAYIYVKLEFLDNKLPWTLIKPNDFSDKSKILEFKNCTLDKEIIIK